MVPTTKEGQKLSVYLSQKVDFDAKRRDSFHFVPLAETYPTAHQMGNWCDSSSRDKMVGSAHLSFTVCIMGVM